VQSSNFFLGEGCPNFQISSEGFLSKWLIAKKEKKREERKKKEILG
jgi:hypothetical protein